MIEESETFCPGPEKAGGDWAKPDAPGVIGIIST